MFLMKFNENTTTLKYHSSNNKSVVTDKINSSRELIAKAHSRYYKYHTGKNSHTIQSFSVYLPHKPKLELSRSCDSLYFIDNDPYSTSDESLNNYLTREVAEEKVELKYNSLEDLISKFNDKTDEVYHWKTEYYNQWLRISSLADIRHLPIYMDRYQHLIYRLFFAIVDWITLKNECIYKLKATPEIYAQLNEFMDEYHTIFRDTALFVNKDAHDLNLSQELDYIRNMDIQKYTNWCRTKRNERNEILLLFSS